MDYRILWTVVATLAAFFPDTQSKITEKQLKHFLENEYEKIMSNLCTKVANAEWNYSTDLRNTQKQKHLLDVTLEAAAKRTQYWRKYFKDLNVTDYHDPYLKRQIKILKILQEAALDEETLSMYKNVTNHMTNVYSTAKICPYNKQQCDLATEGLALNPEAETTMTKSRNYDELVYIWKAWRDASGAKIKNLYKTYVELSNKVAAANGFSDKGEMWRDRFESPNFVEVVDNLWTQIEPLYIELHKYVGKKLKCVYGDKLDISDGLIPAHVFGNMWAQQWDSIADIVTPYPDARPINITSALIEQKYSVLDMFKTSDYFYQSMGLLPNGICYNTSAGAVIEKPTDGRELICHPSAWDFCDGKNYRIKMCTKINSDDFTVIHHEMGHIQYFLQYAQEPLSFRTGANPGFHEAVGDTIALSVVTPKHLEKIGLLKNYVDSLESSINSLMNMALEKVAFFPFALLTDKWRWDVFKGTVQPNEWNSHWWEYRKKYQRIKPPTETSNYADFDPGSKFHVARDMQYISYFVANILQFQFYRSLCIAAGEYDPFTKKTPLHKCDFYNSIEAGQKFSAGLSLGAGRHWSDALELMTGERELDARALMEYFEPLYCWLKEQNSEEDCKGSVLLAVLVLALILCWIHSQAYGYYSI